MRIILLVVIVMFAACVEQSTRTEDSQSSREEASPTALIDVATAYPATTESPSVTVRREGNHHSRSLVDPLPTPTPNCPLGTTPPRGQASPSIEAEPMGAVWCFPLAPAPPTRVSGPNSWVDDFDTNQQMVRLDSGDMDYVIFDMVHNQYGKVKHFINANHWMVDLQGVNNQTPAGWTLMSGATMRPNRSFTFENGRLVVELDVAAAVPEYDDGNQLWPEVTWSTSPAIVNDAVENLYIYGHFKGHWASGCRINTGRYFTCALQYPHAPIPAEARNRCGAITDGNRLWEISHFQQCGTVHNYGIMPEKENRPWRQCRANQMDMFCRDRLRFEWSKAGLVTYVNGVKFFEDSGWPAAQQLPEQIVNGTTPLYVYFGQRGGMRTPHVLRVHWDRIAVNPRDADTHIQPPTQSPSYCPGQPQDTCPMIMTAAGGLATVSKSTVDILDFVYSPSDVTIEAGATVTWRNASGQGLSHSVTGVTGQFDSEIFSAGQQVAFTFDTPGVYRYSCIPHPTMQGSVTVVPKP